jgi:ABC-type phosphate transport system substrate-binding protein
VILQEQILESLTFSGQARIAATDAFMRQEVKSTAGAIGYTMLGNINGDSIRIDGFAAAPETVGDQSYPLSTPIYFVALAEPVGAPRDFLAWIQSPAGQDALAGKYGRVR